MKSSVETAWAIKKTESVELLHGHFLPTILASSFVSEMDVGIPSMFIIIWHNVRRHHTFHELPEKKICYDMMMMTPRSL